MSFEPQKRLNIPWSSALFGPIKLDFVAPYPLETSLERLKQREKTGVVRRDQLMVNFTLEDADTFSFHLKRSGGFQAAVNAHGYLKRGEADSTHVTARISLSLYNYLFFGLLILIIVIFVIPSFRYPAAFIVLFAIVIAFNFSILRSQAHRLANLIEQALRADVSGD